MDHYTKYVPSVYIPEISVFMEILNTLDMYESYEYLPQIWTDLVDFEYARKDILALNVSSLMAKCDSKEATLQEAFCLIAKEIIERYQKIISDEKQAMYYDIT